MDISYNKNKAVKCIKYLHRHKDAWMELCAVCEECLTRKSLEKRNCGHVKFVNHLFPIDQIITRYDEWVDHYYQLDEEAQNLFSEYWYPIGNDFTAEMVFIDLLVYNLPVIVIIREPNFYRITVCASLLDFVKKYKSKNRIYRKRFSFSRT